ncbi:hypothetical protein KW786_00545 [Candidatus Parcubacteria bacterium]|nr:hypothetical protein [Candidatus Parcubacteria bacterium]
MNSAFRLPVRFEIPQPDPFCRAKRWIIAIALAILAFGLGVLTNYCVSNSNNQPAIRQPDAGWLPLDVDEEIEARAQGKLAMILQDCQGILYIKDDTIWAVLNPQGGMARKQRCANLRPGAVYIIRSYVADGEVGRGLASDSEGNFFLLEWQMGNIPPPSKSPKRFAVIAQNRIEFEAPEP